MFHFKNIKVKPGKLKLEKTKQKKSKTFTGRSTKHFSKAADVNAKYIFKHFIKYNIIIMPVIFVVKSITFPFD